MTPCSVVVKYLKRWCPVTTYTASQPERWKQHGPLKRWYPTTTLHLVTTQKTSTCTIIAVKTSNLAF